MQNEHDKMAIQGNWVHTGACIMWVRYDYFGHRVRMPEALSGGEGGVLFCKDETCKFEKPNNFRPPTNPTMSLQSEVFRSSIDKVKMENPIRSSPNPKP